MNRKEGYYWCKRVATDKWSIEFWTGKCWIIPYFNVSNGSYSGQNVQDVYFSSINETPIPNPDEDNVMTPPEMKLADEYRELALSVHKPEYGKVLAMCKEAAECGSTHIVIDKPNDGVFCLLKRDGFTFSVASVTTYNDNSLPELVKIFIKW